MNKGDVIYFLNGYNWECGTVLSVGKKNYKIRSTFMDIVNERYVNKDKCAFVDEKVCVVWEMWRGCNGRGGYRVERILYPNVRVPAQQVFYQVVGYNNLGRVEENSYGIERKNNE